MNREDLAAAVGKIVQNPEFAGLIRELQGNNAGPSEESGTQEILSRLPEAMSLLEPIFSGSPAADSRKSEASESAESSGAPDEPRKKENPVSDRSPAAQKYDKARAERLMNALKPYLKPERCEIIDKCLSVLQLTDVMETLKTLEDWGRAKS